LRCLLALWSTRDEEDRATPFIRRGLQPRRNITHVDY
jgi:hypothetical protein